MNKGVSLNFASWAGIIVTALGGALTNYVTINNRVTRVETVQDLQGKEMQQAEVRAQLARTELLQEMRNLRVDLARSDKLYDAARPTSYIEAAPAMPAPPAESK